MKRGHNKDANIAIKYRVFNEIPCRIIVEYYMIKLQFDFFPSVSNFQDNIFFEKLYSKLK
jgi:hypothetical protein